MINGSCELNLWHHRWWKWLKLNHAALILCSRTLMEHSGLCSEQAAHIHALSQNRTFTIRRSSAEMPQFYTGSVS